MERDYYNENTKLATEQRKLVEENYLQNQGKVKCCSVDATAHYSFDWAQNVQVPHFSQQPSQMYFLSARKVYLFGIQNEANGEQINYVLDEDELLDKGSNGTLSLVFDGIKRLNWGEKHLKLTCDNAAGQNKNNVSLWFCLYLIIAGYYKTIELNFMIAGHTKFSPDRNFGMIKKLYWKSTIYSKEEFVRMVKESSPVGLNKTQCYESGQGFRYLDFKTNLGNYFEKLGGIQKYHHFLFTADNLGIVKVQEEANGKFKEFNLLKTDGREISKIIEEIGSLTFTELVPKLLKLERQEYLYRNIRSLIPEKYREITFPKPAQSIEPKYLVSSPKKYWHILRKFRVNSEMEAEVRFTSDRVFASFLNESLTKNSTPYF